MKKATKETSIIFFKLFRQFIKEMQTGKRLKPDGKRVREATVNTYLYTYKLLIRFHEEKDFNLFIQPITKNFKEQGELRKYWKSFYFKFTDFLFKDLNHHDNYVGHVIKCIRTFFNYLNKEKDQNIGNFHLSFYPPKEEISIIALNPTQLNYLIYDKDLQLTLNKRLAKIKDMFVFGCTVCLRVSDLLNLHQQNLFFEQDTCYLRVYSQKTNKFTSIKLPDYAIQIINKYKSKTRRVFPKISYFQFNDSLKELGRFLKYDEVIVKTRNKRGVPYVIYKDPINKKHFTLSDLITTHTMRRTGITNMLRLGIPDYLVRKISGHSPNSKEFYRYVQLAQNFLDEKTDEFFEKLKNLS